MLFLLIIKEERKPFLIANLRMGPFNVICSTALFRGKNSSGNILKITTTPTLSHNFDYIQLFRKLVKQSTLPYHTY